MSEGVYPCETGKIRIEDGHLPEICYRCGAILEESEIIIMLEGKTPLRVSVKKCPKKCED